jgi:site-specific DNA-methyltransferase (adenine-specific)/adenine-specific DNA-methyltransferase
MSLGKHEINDIIERLQNGEEIPEDYKYKLFPVKQKEYELIYGGKMRSTDVLANEDGVSSVPLQIEKIFNGQRKQWKDGWRNIVAFGDNLQFLKTIYENKDQLIKNKIKEKVKLIYIDPPFGTGDEYDGNSGQAAYSAKTKGAEFVEFIRRRIIVANELLANDGWIFVRQGFHFGHHIKLTLDEIFGKHNFTNEMIVNRVKKNVTKKGKRNIPNAVDHVYVYRKSEDSQLIDVLKKLGTKQEGYWHGMDSSGISGPRFLIIEKKKYLPPAGTHLKFTQKQADEMYKEKKIRVNPNTQKLQYWVEAKDVVNLDSNWTDIPGYTFTTGYPTENSEQLLERIIRATTVEGDIVLDFFGGSGTTAAVAEKLNRKWITCDIGKLAFYTIQKRLLNIQSSKSLINTKKQYDYQAKSFITLNTGHYDLAKVFNLQQKEYCDFVMNLFEVELKKKTISGIQIDGEKKDGFNVIIWQYWNFKDSTVDEDYLKDLHSHIGSKTGNRVYIIAPANYVDFISDYYEIDKVRYYFLKVPYHIIKELHKVQFKKFRQPQSKSNVNDLDDAIGFHFMRQPEVKSEIKIKDGAVQITIKKFYSDFSEEETDQDMSNFESLSMVLIDKNFDGETFDMDLYYFAQDLLPKKKIITEDENIENIKEELKQIKQILLPSILKKECGKKIMAIYVDIYGNEFKEEFGVAK